MLYHLFKYLEEQFDIPGASVFQFISSRVIFSLSFSIVLSILIGYFFLKKMKKNKISENVRSLGLENENLKKKTPSMGGLIIIFSIFFCSILFNNLTNIYVLLLLFTLITLGIIGYIDDYIKIFKKNKSGLKAKYKLIIQLFVGCVFVSTIYVHNSHSPHDATLSTTIPFFKSLSLDYLKVPELFGLKGNIWGWILYGFVCLFIISGVSNSVNLTDGLDGLAVGSVAISCSVLSIFAYLSGNIIFSEYLFFTHIPETGEITIFLAAVVGACMGFLWYNAHPAQIFMGDVGSLTLGGIIAITALMIKKELLLPLLGGIFMLESLSVIIQVTYFKYTKRRTGIGKRVFKMSPLHHHYQLSGWKETKVVARFWIIGILLAGITLATLKLR